MAIRCSSPTAASCGWRLSWSRKGRSRWPSGPHRARRRRRPAAGAGIRPSPHDRHGRLLAQAWLAAADSTKGVWLQEMLLTQGLARVASTDDARALVPELLRIEAQARAARRGLWADPAYRVRTPADAGDALDSFQIVEGRVRRPPSCATAAISTSGPTIRPTYVKLQPRRTAAPAGERHRLQVVARRSPARPRLAKIVQWPADRHHPSRTDRGPGMSRPRISVSLWVSLLLAVAGSGMAGCTTNPATGEFSFTGLMSEFRRGPHRPPVPSPGIG